MCVRAPRPAKRLWSSDGSFRHNARLNAWEQRTRAKQLARKLNDKRRSAPGWLNGSAVRKPTAGLHKKLRSAPEMPTGIAFTTGSGRTSLMWCL